MPKPEGAGMANPGYKCYIPLWYAHLLGKGRNNCIIFIKRLVDFNCRFKLWAQNHPHIA